MISASVGKSGSRQVPDQVRSGGLGVAQQVTGGLDHLVHVVGRDIGGHAHGDAGAAVEQHMRQPRRQHHRLVHGAVEVGSPVHGALAELGEQHLGELRQPRLGVAHGGERLGVVGTAPVALAIHQRVAVAERLGHQHHRLVAGAVAVGMELAQHVADGTRRLLVLGAGIEGQLAHGVDDAPLHRLHAVADMRQRPVEDDVHRIVEVRLLGVLAQREAFDVALRHLDIHGHTVCPWSGCPKSLAVLPRG